VETFLQSADCARSFRGAVRALIVHRPMVGGGVRQLSRLRTVRRVALQAFHQSVTRFVKPSFPHLQAQLPLRCWLLLSLAAASTLSAAPSSASRVPPAKRRHSQTQRMSPALFVPNFTCVVGIAQFGLGCVIVRASVRSLTVV
jgi:hypothetical protein